MTDYGTKIAELRAANKMTQAQLGEKLNVTSQAVSKWENGLSEPDIESIRKICQIFNISFDEFFGAEDQTEEDTEAESAEEPKAQAQSVVLAYCDTCDKPLYNPKDYQVTIENGVQHTTCLACVPKKAQAKQQAERQARERKRSAEKQANWRDLRKGMLWGIVGGVALAVIMLIVGITQKDTVLAIVGTILGAYGGFAMLTQMIWMNSVWDVFLFFLKTVKWPGVIFTLDLEGIFFLIFVKILFAILGAIIGVLLFILGFLVTWAYSMIIFPFALIKELREL